ncbi:MAG: hypothetical protein COB39_13560 [Marinosulfonomonas sp.]|nr:MAG: hypothetical protein COB39_13560 [Marinosulfonomonas sp.]
MLIGIPAYVFYRLYTESPKRLERLAREETQLLFDHALAGSVHLSDAEVETTFATFVRSLTERAVPISFPFFVLEKRPQASKEKIDAIRKHSRKSYAEPWKKAPAHSEPPENQEPDKMLDNPDDDPTRPSPEL